PGTEALPGGAAEPDVDRRVRRAFRAIAARDLAREARADRAVEVLDLVPESAAGARFDRRYDLCHHPLRELALVERAVALGDAELRRIRGQSRRRHDAGKVEAALARRLALPELDQVHAADEVGEAAHAELRHDEPH